VQNWRDAAPRRVIPGTSFSEGFPPGGRVAHEELRKAFTKDGFKVMGEIGLQYEGLSPSDASVDAYFALAEELDVPVAIHMGTGGSGRANVAMPKFRGSMGNPLLLEDLLARHPKLRVQVMHAGYPMIDNMLTLLQASSHVYVDVAGLIWSYPLKEVGTPSHRGRPRGAGEPVRLPEPPEDVGVPSGGELRPGRQKERDRTAASQLRAVRRGSRERGPARRSG
jgi:predicted TIM-barrel fold metal-dependent hydrolase